jgi:hypothetical protein
MRIGNLDSKRFCDDCGTALSSAPTGHARSVRAKRISMMRVSREIFAEAADLEISQGPAMADSLGIFPYNPRICRVFWSHRFK